MNERELVARLAKLERSNRRLKHGALAVVVLAAALGAMAATRPVPDKITAHEFNLVDAAGKVRVNISLAGGEPTIAFNDAREFTRLQMDLAMGEPHIQLWDAAVRPSERRWVPVADPRIPDIAIFSAQGSAPAIVLGVGAKDTPSITLSDSHGFGMNLGSTGMVTRAGATQQTSAASITMFGNDKNHHVIWQAP